MRILIPRAAGAGAALSECVRARGYDVAEVPLMELVYDIDAVLIALRAHPESTLVLTSPAAARAVARALDGGVHAGPIVAVGAGTAERLGPDARVTVCSGTARDLAAALPHRPSHVLLWPRAEAPTPGTREQLAARGALVEVVAYTNRAPADLPSLLAALPPIDLALVTAASVARRLAEAWPGGSPPPVISMGPSASEAARAAGLVVAGQATPPGVPGLLRALDAWQARGSSAD